MVPSSISKSSQLKAWTADLMIGGLRQRVWARGIAPNKPLLLFLHGGPGVSGRSLMDQYQSHLEKHFIVVNWDQRGAGKSFSRHVPKASMTVAQFESDLHEIVLALRARFHVEKIFLLGHSWGSILGTIYAYRHPENVAAYVGAGQVANMKEGERLSYDFTLSEAKLRKDHQAIRQLEHIGPPPHSPKQVFLLRAFTEKFGGGYGPGNSQRSILIWPSLKTLAGIHGLLNLTQGLRFSFKSLFNEAMSADLTSIKDFKVPMHFMLGRHDHQVPAELAARYFETLSAPEKTIDWFENSGHWMLFEEADRFSQTLVRRLLRS